MAVAVFVSFQPRKLRSRRFAIASNIINIIVTIVTGVATPGSACWLLFSEGGEPALRQWRATRGRRRRIDGVFFDR